MHRRTVLRAAGAVGVIGLAGCTGGENSDGTGTPDESDAVPTITDSSITTVSADCASDETQTGTSSAETGSEEVTIEGVVQASDPCHEAVLANAEYDVESDTLQVSVVTEAQDGVCAQCLGAIEYEATVTFANGVPGSVTVSHEQDTPTTPDTPDGSDAVTDTQFTVTTIDQDAQSETVDIQFDEDATAVALTGTIEGSNGCKTATLDGATYDSGSDTLTVAVATMDREGTEDQACTDALVSIDYEATVTMADALPDVVEVTHDGRGIASGSYGTASAGEDA